MAIDFIRPWVYWVVNYNWKIVLTKKTRGPYSWMYDLPWWWLNFWEDYLDCLRREISEEIWLYNIDDLSLLNVFKAITEYEKNWEDYHTHLLCIIYSCSAMEKPDLAKISQIDNDTDSFIFIDPNDYINYELTPVARESIEFYLWL